VSQRASPPYSTWNSRCSGRRATVKPDDGVIDVFSGASRLEERPALGYVGSRNLESAPADCSSSRRAHPAPALRNATNSCWSPPDGHTE
jgi:hypothetical protein